MNICSIKNNRKNGYAVLELLFYIAIFAVVSLVVINALITMTASFKETAIQGDLTQSSTIMEKIVREIRQATSISSISGSDLTLNTTDTSGTAKTVEFLLSGHDIQYLENGTLTGNLNTPKITITALAFTDITTTAGKAVKVVLDLESANDTLNRVQEFDDTTVLRGSYK